MTPPSVSRVRAGYLSRSSAGETVRRCSRDDRVRHLRAAEPARHAVLRRLRRLPGLVLRGRRAAAGGGAAAGGRAAARTSSSSSSTTTITTTAERAGVAVPAPAAALPVPPD